VRILKAEVEDVPKRIAMGDHAQSGSRAILTATPILARR
jgi:hypothetical protein